MEVAEGAQDGALRGAMDGGPDGWAEGRNVGDRLGTLLGTQVGSVEGLHFGVADGDCCICVVGGLVGSLFKMTLGAFDIAIDGLRVGFSEYVGLFVRAYVGEFEIEIVLEYPVGLVHEKVVRRH